MRQQAVESMSHSVEETQAFGERLGRLLAPGDLVALEGELGSGKTTLIQGIAQGLGINPHLVKSPTFVLMREYPGSIPLIHLDGYRLDDPQRVPWLDVELLFSPQKVTVVEWAQRFGEWIPAEHLIVRTAYVSTHRRRFTLLASGERAKKVLSQLI